MKEKPLFDRDKEHTCGPGKTPVKGFTRKDGRKVAPFCSTKKKEVSLSSIVMEADADKALVKMAETDGCEAVLKKLEFLGRVSKDEKLQKRLKERINWLKGHATCKIVRKPEKKEEKL